MLSMVRGLIITSWIAKAILETCRLRHSMLSTQVLDRLRPLSHAIGYLPMLPISSSCLETKRWGMGHDLGTRGPILNDRATQRLRTAGDFAAPLRSPVTTSCYTVFILEPAAQQEPEQPDDTLAGCASRACCLLRSRMPLGKSSATPFRRPPPASPRHSCRGRSRVSIRGQDISCSCGVAWGAFESHESFEAKSTTRV